MPMLCFCSGRERWHHHVALQIVTRRSANTEQLVSFVQLKFKLSLTSFFSQLCAVFDVPLCGQHFFLREYAQRSSHFGYFLVFLLLTWQRTFNWWNSEAISFWLLFWESAGPFPVENDHYEAIQLIKNGWAISLPVISHDHNVVEYMQPARIWGWLRV